MRSPPGPGRLHRGGAPIGAISGSPQAADSWFLGFQWRLANCAECRRHLGWYFDRPGDEFFFGLILDRIQHDKE